MEKMIVPEFDTQVIIKETDVNLNYSINLLELEYINQPITQERLYIIARLIGAINTIGYLNIKQESYYASFYVDDECDAHAIIDDITKLGFELPQIEYHNIDNQSSEIDNHSYIECNKKSKWIVTTDGSFAYLLSLLGGFIGDKINISKKIPEWIMTGNKLIKREFLSAFQGGCKTTLKYNESNILLSCSSQITTPKFLADTINYMNQIVTMFKDFDINCKVISLAKPIISSEIKQVRNKFVELVFINTVENIIKYVDNINYRYSENIRKKSTTAIEFLKIIQDKIIGKKYNLSEKQITKNKMLYGIDNVSEWQSQSWDTSCKTNCSNDIEQCYSSSCKVKNSLITHLKAKLAKNIGKIDNIELNNALEYQRQTNNRKLNKVDKVDKVENDNEIEQNQFNKQNILPTGDVMIGIKSITQIPNEMIYDFTTFSDNHSFVANSFVVSNCVETPEGSKIGLVKSLAMMASITSQNSTQIDIIKSILKRIDGIKHPYDIDPLTMNSWVKIMLNGDWIGIIKISKAQDTFEQLKKKRRENVIDKTTSIVFDYRNKEIKCFFDGGRLIRPVLIVNNNSLNITPEVVTELNNEMKLVDKSKSWRRLLSNFPNLIEYEDIESLNFLLVAEGEHRLTESQDSSKQVVEYTDTTKINRYGDYRWLKYTHCDFHAWVMMGTVVANVPFSNHNYANRNIIHFSQAKQSIGVYLTSYKDRMDISQVLYHPQIPIVTTQAMKYNGCLDLPYGENAVVAVCSYNGYNQEDSIIFNETSIQRGIFRADTLKKFHSEILKNPSTSQDDIFTKPDRNKVTGMKQGNYDKLNDKGFAPEETILENQDAIIGKISPIQPTGNNNKVYKDNSEIFKTNVQGVIDRVHTGIYNAEGYEMYNVRVRMERKLISGDKMTTRHGQKGTIGITYQQKDMPFTESGIIPDLILNPHGYPKRMSLGHFIECVASKEAAETGHFVDGTPFNNYDISQLPEALQKLGYSPYGTEKMYCGLTGRQMDVEIFIGPVYNIRLKHMVLDKVHGRARGPKQALTRQPLEGRSRDGGLKIGEMEKDAMVAHGMSQFLKERLMETSDISKVYVCDECGMFASKVIDKDYYRCKGCHNSTRISAVVIPHACKLLFQELTSVNILPRIRTERSIHGDES
jgi:hypothetical protein